MDRDKPEDSPRKRLVMLHAAGRQVAAADVAEGGPGAGVLLGVVVFPFDAHGAVEADAVQLDEDLFQAVGVAGRARP